MNANINTVINTKYTLSVQAKKIAEAQAKSNEIKLKDFEIEINNPLSVDVKDYLNDVEKLNASTLKELKLDTSRVNINEAGKYRKDRQSHTRLVELYLLGRASRTVA